MGFFVTFSTERVATLSPELRLLMTTGFLGAYTTFSTYGLDTAHLWRDRSPALAGLYWSGSAILGVLGILLGASLARLGK